MNFSLQLLAFSLFFACSAVRGQVASDYFYPTNLAALEFQFPPIAPAKVLDMNPAHAVAVKTSVISAVTYFAVNGFVPGLSWIPSTDTNVVAVRVYVGPDIDTPELMFTVPAPGTNTGFYCPVPEPFEVWATAVDGAGSESDPSNPLQFVSPPASTNVVLSWGAAPRNVTIVELSNHWEIDLTNVTGTNATFPLLARGQLFRGETTDLPPVVLQIATQ